MACKVKVQNKVISCLSVAFGGGLAFIGINIYKGNDKFYSQILMPSIHKVIDAENSHKIAIKMAKYGFVPKLNDDPNDLPLLRTTLWGVRFANPIGLGAGFDKDGDALSGLSKMGFGFIEVGSVTPEPQEGNPRPRVFRLIPDKAIINRYGFNSAGHDAVKSNLSKYSNDLVLGVNLGKNKFSADAANDYIKGLLKFSDIESVKYLVINISSPNTPHLREYQNKKLLNELMEKIIKVKGEHNISKPLLVKISSDLNHDQLKDIANVINKFSNSKSCAKIDGIIISNTTINRPNHLHSDIQLTNEDGGLSGEPLKDQSTETIRQMYKLTNGKIPIIGVGGVFSGRDAYDKIKAGASLIQIYTALTYDGPPIVHKIKKELSHLLESDRFKNITEAIGNDHR